MRSCRFNSPSLTIQPTGTIIISVAAESETCNNGVDTMFQILVFGVRLNTTSTDSPYHRDFCPQCAVGINSALVAVRRSAVNTEKPDIVWTVQLPTPTSRVKGQVIGVDDKLVAYVMEENGEGSVVAFK